MEKMMIDEKETFLFNLYKIANIYTLKNFCTLLFSENTHISKRIVNKPTDNNPPSKFVRMCYYVNETKEELLENNNRQYLSKGLKRVCSVADISSLICLINWYHKLNKIIPGKLSETSSQDAVVKVMKWIIIFEFFDNDLFDIKTLNDELIDDLLGIQVSSSTTSIVNSFLSEKEIRPSVWNLSNDEYNELRKQLLDKYDGEYLYLSGPTLSKALSDKEYSNYTIVPELKNWLKNKNKTIKLFLTDPSEVILDSSLDDLNGSINCICALFNEIRINACKLEIIFMPSLNVCHTFMIEEYMIFRDTKIWTRKESFKGGFLLFDSKSIEYNSQKKYLEEISTIARTVNVNNPSTATGDARKMHNNIRETIKTSYCGDRIWVKRLDSDSLSK